jgi:hypothetical protein
MLITSNRYNVIEQKLLPSSEFLGFWALSIIREPPTILRTTEFQMVDTFQKPSNSECFSLSSEPFRFYKLLQSGMHSLIRKSISVTDVSRPFRSDERSSFTRSLKTWQPCDVPCLLNSFWSRHNNAAWPQRARRKGRSSEFNDDREEMNGCDDLLKRWSLAWRTAERLHKLQLQNSLVTSHTRTLQYYA